ncbi:hypothetical protein ASD66_14765 [Nocardioides sp. Root151]|nr:hypothetical protein ASD66_14765 [Nocardioides sp. Root151]
MAVDRLMTNVRGAGGVGLWRFLLVTGPATVISLGIGALAVLGYVSVVITSTQPITMASSGGTSDSMVLGVGTVGTIVEDDDALAGDSAAAMVRMGTTHLDDLCLVPRVELPLVGDLLSIRIRSAAPVTLGDVTLAASGARLGGLHTPRTTMGLGAGFEARTEPGPDAITLGDLDLETHGIVLDGGLRLSSLGVRTSAKELSC